MSPSDPTGHEPPDAPAGYVRVARVEELPPGQGVEIEGDGRILAVFNDAGTLRAIDGICPHLGGPLARGCIDQGIVTCPWHGWRFDLRSGAPTIPGRTPQDVFAVQVIDGTIFVSTEPESEGTGEDSPSH